jgi:hypothetical protein
MKTVQITISDFDEKVLKHELLDIEEWLQSALDGKIHKVKARLSKTAQTTLFEDPSIQTIPATVSGSISLYFQQSNYQNAEQRVSASLEVN